MSNRLLDTILSFALIVLAAPLMVVIAVAVRLTSRGPIIYRQERIGRNGVPFTIYKFRTMPVSNSTGDSPHATGDIDFKTYVFDSFAASGPTPMGRFLRMTSLDELPNLFNVLRGDMSLVGPRPEIPELVAKYPPEYHERHTIRPGITGLAQVSGRGRLTYHASILYDLDYVRDHSAGRYLGILFRTVPVVLSRKGAR